MMPLHAAIVGCRARGAKRSFQCAPQTINAAIHWPALTRAWFTKSNTSTAGIRSLGDQSISKKAFVNIYKNEDKCKYLQMLKMK
jgi:hypothetical protein